MLTSKMTPEKNKLTLSLGDRIQLYTWRDFNTHTCQMTSAEAKQAVVGELKGHIYICDAQAFLNRFFPLGDKFENILQALVDNGDYNKSLSKWSSLPENGRYHNFSNLANAICRQALNLELTTPESVNSVWVDSDAQSPKSINTSLDRPDVVNVIGNREDWRQLEKLCPRVVRLVRFRKCFR